MARFGSIGDGQFASLGKANRYKLSRVFSTNTTQTTVNVAAISGYKAGKSDLTITVNSGVYVYSTDVATPALTITGATTGDRIFLVNDGFIIGRGGNGVFNSTFDQVNGLPGGPAMSLGFNISITNNSYIAGGGGSGACGIYPTNGFSGGGAGGGDGGGTGPNYFGGAGGAPGQAGAQGFGSGQAGVNFPNYGGGGGGGRILPGVGGFSSIFSNKPGGGGAGGGSTVSGNNGGSAGAGGSGGDAGEDKTQTYSAGGGGGWGARGGNGGIGVGGAGGKAINLNGFTVTYITTGTVWGAVS